MGKGTEKRQRNCVLKARFNNQEAAAVRELADRAGQSVGSLLRQTLLNIPPTTAGGPAAVRRSQGSGPAARRTRQAPHRDQHARIEHQPDRQGC